MTSIRRAWAAAALACIALAACTSQTDDDDAAGSADTTGNGKAAAQATGITDDTIKVSLIAADLAMLTQQNLAPDIGDPKKTLETIVADINEKGGVAGRKIALTPHVISGADAQLNPDLGQQLCIQATEDDKPFAIIVAAAIPAQILECTAIDHPILTITMDSWPDRYYERAKGRVFSVGSQISLGRDRLYRAWPKILDDKGYLEGKTIGIIRQGTPDQEESSDTALKPAIEKLGYKVAAEASLVCPEVTVSCEQHPVAIQKMRDAHVDLVFLLAQNLAGAATVEAAQNVGFKPQWLTIGNNVTNTVARFYANAKNNYDGAIGVDSIFSGDTPAAAECNRIAVAGGAKKFPVDDDGYGFTAVTCIQLQVLAKAIDSVKGTITQAAVIKAIENLRPVPTDTPEPATLSHDKHDAGTSVFLSKYSAADQRFEPIDDRKPITVAD